MTRQTGIDVIAMVIATGTSLSIGQLVFQGLGTVILGILGALGGYIFVKVIKPRLDKWIGGKKAE